MNHNRKDWTHEEGGLSLEALLGSRGVKTSRIKDRDHLILIAARFFQITPCETCTEMVSAIKSFSKAERRSLAGEARLRSSQPVVGKIERSLIVRSYPPNADAIKDFYNSWNWKQLRYKVLVGRNRRCQCCGASAPSVAVVVDHIRPVRKFWHIRLDERNLQVLCEDCNRGKGSLDQSDWRPEGTGLRLLPD